MPSTKTPSTGPSPYENAGSDAINTMVKRVAPAILGLLADGVPRPKAAIVEALAGRHDRQDVLHTLVRLTVTGQVDEAGSEYTPGTASQPRPGVPLAATRRPLRSPSRRPAPAASAAAAPRRSPAAAGAGRRGPVRGAAPPASARPRCRSAPASARPARAAARPARRRPPRLADGPAASARPRHGPPSLTPSETWCAPVGTAKRMPVRNVRGRRRRPARTTFVERIPRRL